MIEYMKEYFVYMLRCRDSSYYTGVTNNVEERLLQHQRGDDSTAYTFKRRPVQLIYVHSFKNINDAIAAEKRIQGWSRKKKEALIEDNVALLHELSECKNETHYRRSSPFVSAQGDKQGHL